MNSNFSPAWKLKQYSFKEIQEVLLFYLLFQVAIRVFIRNKYYLIQNIIKNGFEMYSLVFCVLTQIIQIMRQYRELVAKTNYILILDISLCKHLFGCN